MILWQKQSNKPVFIVGCGDIGLRVALRYQAKGVSVTGLVRSEERAQILNNQEIQAVIANLDDMDTLDGLSGAERLFYFAPPPAEGSHDTRIQHFLVALQQAGLLNRIVYISTTGVYGNTAGNWVTETSPTQPQTARARRRLDAEQQLQAWCSANQVENVILRVPGIYGGGRWPLQRIKDAKPVLNEAESAWVNRIHAEDLADICVMAMENARSPRIYNVSDNAPSSMTDYFNKVADAFGLLRPPKISRTEAEERLSPAMLSYLDESRRVDGSLLVKELGISLRYPDLDAGLADI